MLMTFAIYVAPDDSSAAFQKDHSDHDTYLTPIQLWGTPENVVRAVEAHNQVVRRLAAEDEQVLFADAARAMDGHAEYFNDVCHLSDAGSEAFVHLLLTGLRQDRPPK